jgi:hypothetical protein
MKADWRAYPNNIGHKEWAGCFRCHDGNHKSSEARAISASNCNSCHTILAQGSGGKMNEINAKGHSFFHIDAVNEDFSCNNCHTGPFPKSNPDSEGPLKIQAGREPAYLIDFSYAETESFNFDRLSPNPMKTALH